MAHEEKKDQTLWNLEKLKVMSRGNEAFVAKMLQIFKEQTSIRLIELKNALAVGDFKLIGEIAHKMKPGLDSFCIDAVRESVRHLERNTEFSKEENEIQCQYLIAVLHRVLSEMEKG